jgi:tetratricopeptide (TPR) repeat protein/transposase-like protein
LAVRQLKYPPEFKKEVCEYAKKATIIKAADSFKVSRKTLGKWLRAYKSGSIEALSERKKRSDSGKGKLDYKTTELVFKYKNKHPETTYKEIKEKYSIGCTLSLIAGKVKKYRIGYLKKNPEKKARIFVLGYRVLRSIPGRIPGVKCKFRLEMYDNLNDRYYISESESISNSCLNLFLKSVKLCAEKEESILTPDSVKTNIKYFKCYENEMPVEYDRKSNKAFERLKPGTGYEIPHEISAKVRFLSLTYKSNSNKSDNLTAVKNALIFSVSGTKALTDVFVCKIDQFGDEFYRSYDFDKALVSYSNLYSLADKCADNKKYKIKSLYKQADIYYRYDKYTTSMNILNELISYKDRCCESFNEGHIYYYLGKIYSIENEKEKSRECFTMSVKLFIRAGKEFFFDYLRAEINKNLVNRSFNRALNSAIKYLKAARKLNDPSLICDALDLRGLVYFKLKNYLKALTDYTNQINIAKDSLLYSEESKAISNLLCIYALDISADQEQIEKYTKRSEFLSMSINDKLNLNHIYQSLGNFYFNRHDFNKAITYLSRSSVYCKMLGNNRHYSISRHYLGLSYFYTGKYSEALSIFSEVFGYRYCDSEIRIHSGNYIGRCLFNLNKTDKAIEAYKAAMKYAAADRNYDMTADALKCIGQAFRTQNCIKKSKAYFKRSLRMYKKLYRNSRLSNTLENIRYIEENLQELDLII